MKIFKFFIITSVLIFAVSCSQDEHEIPNGSSEIELNMDDTSENEKKIGIPNKPPPTLNSGFQLSANIGTWYSVQGCTYWGNETNLFRTINDCLCYKNSQQSTYSGANGHCYDVTVNCARRSSGKPFSPGCNG